MTKLEMAVVIVGALHGSGQPASPDNWWVRRKLRLPKWALEHEYDLALKSITSRAEN